LSDSYELNLQRVLQFAEHLFEGIDPPNQSAEGGRP
jgi:hypothetical protein